MSIPRICLTSCAAEESPWWLVDVHPPWMVTQVLIHRYSPQSCTRSGPAKQDHQPHQLMDSSIPRRFGRSHVCVLIFADSMNGASMRSLILN